MTDNQEPRELDINIEVHQPSYNAGWQDCLDNQESPSRELEQKGDLSDKLRECPFCGSPAYGKWCYDLYIIECVNACCTQQDFFAPECIKLWNTRAPSKQLSATQQALDSAVEAQQWQPIETAPKDGTVILTCGDVPKFARISYCIHEKWEYYPYISKYEVKQPYWWRSLDSLNMPFERDTLKKPITSKAALAAIKE